VVERRVRAELACIVQVGTVLGENVGMENCQVDVVRVGPGVCPVLTPSDAADEEPSGIDSH